jgi:hypothetical protein
MAINMSNDKTIYEDILAHVGHEVAVASYQGWNVAIECVTCGTVLIDVDKPEEE